MESTPQNVFRLADEFFMKQSPIHQAAERIAKELTKLGIDFAVGDGFAFTYSKPGKHKPSNKQNKQQETLLHVGVSFRGVAGFSPVNQGSPDGLRQ